MDSNVAVIGQHVYSATSSWNPNLSRLNHTTHDIFNWTITDHLAAWLFDRDFEGRSYR